MRSLALVLALVALPVAASRGQEAAPPAAAAPPSPAVESLLAADRAWSQTPPDAEAFAAAFADDGVFLPPDVPSIEGRAAIEEAARELFAGPGVILRWQPAHAEVAASGDLGYTRGSYALERRVDDETRVEHGKYVTVWRRGPEGAWSVAADIFNAEGPEKPAATASAGPPGWRRYTAE